MPWDKVERRANGGHEECLHDEWRKNVDAHVKKGDDAMVVVHNHETRIKSLEDARKEGKEASDRLFYSLIGSTLSIIVTMFITWGASREVQGRLLEKVDRIEKQHDMEYARDLKKVGEYEKHEILREGPTR